MPASFSIGDVLAGKYRVLRVLGEGGMGVVYEAAHLSLGEHVAIKVLQAAGDPTSPAGDFPGSSGLVARLLREARAAARIKSEHVARVNDFGVLSDGVPYLVMELIEGRNLADMLRDRGPLPVEVAVRYILEVCLALAEAHSLGIVHRDVKPSNLIVAERRDGSELVKVLDFGVAKQLGTAASTLTASQGAWGSPSYMSPEQIRDARSVDERGDVWSLGVVLYEMLTRRLPFEAFTAPGVLAAITADDPTPPREHRPDLDPGLERIVLDCLEKDQRQRPESVTILAERLAPFTPRGSELAERVRRLRETPHELERAARREYDARDGAQEAPTQNTSATTAGMPKSPPRRARVTPLLAFGAVLIAIAIAGTRATEERRAAPREQVTPAASTSVAHEADAAPALREPGAVLASATSGTPPAPSARAIRIDERPRSPAILRSSTPTVSASPPAPAAAASQDELEYGYRK